MRIAAFQRFAIAGAPGRVADLVLRDVHWADRQGIDLAVFPEAYLTGHSYERPAIQRLAICLDHAVLQHLTDELSRFRTTTVLGLFERQRTNVYNSVLVVSPAGIVGRYAKRHPIEDGCTPGDASPVWRCGTRVFGINICADLNHPAAADRLVEQGASLICCPLNMMLRLKKAERWRGPALDNLRSVARRTGCWVVSADVCGPDTAGWLSFGCTAIVQPDGTVRDQVAEQGEGVAVFDFSE